MTIEKIQDIGGFARFKSESRGFTVVSNDTLALISNIELRGLYISLLSLPTEWKIHKSQLGAQFNIGSRKLNSYFAQLVRLGLLSIKQLTDAKGRFTGTDYTVHLLPTSVSAKSACPDTPGGADSACTETARADMASYKEIDINKEKKEKGLASPACPLFEQEKGVDNEAVADSVPSSTPQPVAKEPFNGLAIVFDDLTNRYVKAQSEPEKDAFSEYAHKNYTVDQIAQFCVYSLNSVTQGKWPQKGVAYEMAIKLIKKGYTLKDFMHVIVNKYKAWRDSEKMKSNLTPKTLFNPINFEIYAYEPEDLGKCVIKNCEKSARRKINAYGFCVQHAVARERQTATM